MALVGERIAASVFGLLDSNFQLLPRIRVIGSDSLAGSDGPVRGPTQQSFRILSALEAWQRPLDLETRLVERE